LKPIAVILTEASTHDAKCQLYEHAERGKIREGMFLLVYTTGERRILARVAKIIPQNEFFVAGDAWTEARRKQQEIPSGLARKYEICELELLREVPGFTEISIPPYAGDKVFEIDISKDLKSIFGVVSPEGIIWYGSLLGYVNAPIPLTIEAIPMHFAIFGVTGSGKSYDVGALIEELVKIPAGENTTLSIPMVIIDANADYIDYHEYFKKRGRFGSCPSVTRYVFPNSPIMKTYQSHVRPIAINLNNLSLRDLAELIVTYYSGGQKNELQVAGIEILIDNMIARGDITEGNFQNVFTNPDAFDRARARLAALSHRNTPIHSATAAAIQRGLNKFREIENQHGLLSAKPSMENDFIDDLTSNREIAIIDFSADGAPGIPLSVKQLVISYISSILFRRFTYYKTERQERYLIFLIEEAQNYCPNLSRYDVGYSLAREKMGMIATQGRKFGLSLGLVSQRPSFIDPVVLSMCNTFFIHRIAPDDMSFIVRACGGLPSSLERRLTRLELGEVIVNGQMNVTPFSMVIKIPRRKTVPEHEAGKTEVLKALKRLSK
jgi:hypothetical protein